ncbi:uncharacterized protein LOC110943435 [Helianthus annuus]|uniref:uncharacterized protein LOC110943435 n=1 Tax=Helianthus annuus TaxID=4232 RepID=UPI000B8F7997|nr:uncharacterized protein LOC110943435 [Helianthus annuus]
MENIIAQGIADTIPLIIKVVRNHVPIENNKVVSSKCNRSHDFSHNVNGDNDMIIRAPFPKKMKAMTSRCTYKDFLACKPTEFAGSEGAMTTLRWLENTEVVLKISKRAEEDKVMYASNLFRDEALEWWNVILQAKGSDMAYAMNWKEFKEMIERKFCPPHEKDQMANKFLNHKMADANCLKAARPQTIEETVELANTLTDRLIRTREENQNKELAQKITQEFHSGNTYRRKGVGQSSTPPFCRNCRRKHSGKCNFRRTPYCNFYKKTGHVEEECRRKTNICFNCGETDHIKPYCPKLTKAPDNKAKAADRAKKNAQAFVLTAQEAGMIPGVIAAFNQPLTKLSQVCTVEMVEGNSTNIREILQGGKIELLGHKFTANLLPMNLAGFDVVLGMDWLVANHARILCDQNTIEIRMPIEEMIMIRGDKPFKSTKFIFVMKAASYARKQGIVYMIFVIISTKGKELKEILIISEYPDVFPEDLPGLSPGREVEFRIHLISGITPIAKATYRLAPTKMLELKKQLGIE